MPEIEITTLGLLRELTSGDTLAVLAAAPSLASYGDEEDALLEARMFLSEHLAKAEPEVVARFALPKGTRVHRTNVVIPRGDLTRRWNVDAPISITSLIIPTIPNTKSLRDAWVMIVPLAHTCFISATKEGISDDDLDELIDGEVKRIVAAREMSPLEYLDLLPARDERVENIEVIFYRGETSEIAQGANRRKKLAEIEARKHAVEVLESIADPLHATVHRPKPFPLRDAELDLLRSMLSGKERASTLLIGSERVGKSGLFRAWLEREHEVNRPRFVYATSGARLIANMSGFGQWQERVRRVMEAAHLLDAILYFDDLGDLFTDRPGGHVDIPSALRPFLEESRVRVVGEIREDVLERVEARNAGFFSCFGRVRIEALDAQSTHTILTELSKHHAKDKEKPVLTNAANATLIELAERYLPYESFPGKAVRLMNEIRAAQEIALGSEAAGAAIGPDVVHETFSLRTGVPLFLLRDDRSLRVDDVDAKLHERLIGQNEAVRKVAELVGVVKAGLQPAGKPLATLLFVGPTGVGKTELARSLASLLFSSEDRLIRFDMSEYASAFATERLFRGVDGGEGLLTRKIREQPFSVVLLDEIEKAHPAAFDLLLQVCGEGRLTDGRGKTAYFHNAILIMTSNLGASHRKGDDAHYTKVVRETFRPEMVNRIDRIVAFRPLTKEEILEVARITTARISRRRGIVERGIDLAISEDALSLLAEGGVHEAYGARALRRHLERELVTPVGKIISAAGEIDGDRIKVEKSSGEDGSVSVELVKVSSRRGGHATHALESITFIRRQANRQLRLERIEEIREQVAYISAQLSHGSQKKKKKDAPTIDGQQFALLHAEHARLNALIELLDKAFAEICAVEELALVGFMNGEAIESLLDEAESARSRFRASLVRALVALEPMKSGLTIMIKELDGGRAMDRWLLPLLADVDRRKWRVDLHIDGDKGGGGAVGWPEKRRWGPPRTPAAAADLIRSPDRTFRNVLLRAEGDHASIWLALEAGLHRFAFFGPGEPAHLHISIAALRTTLTEGEWEPPFLDPPTPLVANQLAKLEKLRDHDATLQYIEIVDGRARVELRLEDYWPRFEEVALEHLLLFETDATLDRDGQLRPIEDDRFAEVRELVRTRQMINAIKKYREITGASLKDSKDAVEAMQS